MVDIRTGKQMTRGGFLKGILASGIAPSITLSAVSLAGSANAGVGRGMMRNVGARNAAMFGGESLPYDEELEYIQSNRNQYINTGVLPSNLVSFYLVGCFVSYTITTSADEQILGSRGSGYYEIDLSRNVLYWQFASSSMSAQIITPGVSGIYENRYGSFYIDGIHKISFSGSFSNSYPVYLFAMNNKGTLDRMSASRISYCKFYNATGDLAEFIPVLKEGVPCMYDKVGCGFYYNLLLGHQFGYKKKDGTIVDPT